MSEDKTVSYKKGNTYHGYKKERSFLVQKRGQLMGLVGFIDNRIDHLDKKLFKMQQTNPTETKE